jgi:hypothetical protein
MHSKMIPTQLITMYNTFSIQCTIRVQYPLPPLSLRAQENLESLKKSSVVVIQILMLYLLINNLCKKGQHSLNP